MSKREAIEAAFEQLYRAVCGLSMGDIDATNRSQALEWLNECNGAVMSGLRARDDERRREEDARILKAYREGRLIEVGK